MRIRLIQEEIYVPFYLGLDGWNLGDGIQGTSKRLFPGCENMRWKHCGFLPAEGKQNATLSPEFTQPGKSLLEIPCTG